METLRTFLRALRAIVAYYREAGSAEICEPAVHAGCDSACRMNRISDSYKALLLASPGR